MKATKHLLSVADVAFFLSRHLGPDLQWVDFLNDCRRKEARNIHGCRLLPVCRTAGTTSTARRPLYRPADVSQFIREVRDRAGIREPFPFVARAYVYDDRPASNDSEWVFRVAAPA